MLYKNYQLFNIVVGTLILQPYLLYVEVIGTSVEQPLFSPY